MFDNGVPVLEPPYAPYVPCETVYTGQVVDETEGGAYTLLEAPEVVDSTNQKRTPDWWVVPFLYIALFQVYVWGLLLSQITTPDLAWQYPEASIILGALPISIWVALIENSNIRRLWLQYLGLGICLIGWGSACAPYYFTIIKELTTGFVLKVIFGVASTLLLSTMLALFYPLRSQRCLWAMLAMNLSALLFTLGFSLQGLSSEIYFRTMLVLISIDSVMFGLGMLLFSVMVASTYRLACSGGDDTEECEHSEGEGTAIGGESGCNRDGFNQSRGESFCANGCLVATLHTIAPTVVYCTVLLSFFFLDAQRVHQILLRALCGVSDEQIGSGSLFSFSTSC